ncbi:hypothetical protein COK99_17940 [Bacillus thuringiensis]|uniref:HPP family protein n=2 Tax=Bacillus thuringiensis TaxID=1428 RepID=A0A9X7GD26_BACTU|nr:hypothetical protein COM85_03225 [Bacillus thuringiensis]PFE34319.1 hypothetical protein CN312_28090 [Bacillus thuringiensis]PFU10948.1 hypothetical protein COK78_02830 [Bacillus thuringiensis]PFV29290.1 hypothetical protein COK99_17940 [Bacillus thuringiensis]PGL31641.1 hypothetical protein CN916_11900 [Bacillus thuringiensis]
MKEMSTKEYVIMNAVISKKETIISYTIAILFILAMVTAGVLLNDPEVILPEIAAMAIALWAYREPGWLRQPEKIFIAPSITAVIGFMVNQMDIAYLGKVSLTLVFMMLFLRVIQSNLAPSIATGLLPLVTNATEWSFVIAVFALTFILMVGVLIFKLNNGIKRKVQIQYKYMTVFLILNFVWISLCWITGYEQLAVIPPILVVVYESLQKPMYNEKMAFKQIVVLTTSATVGPILYFAIDSWIVVTLLNMILMLILLKIVGVRIPAVYAFPLLPLVFPDGMIKMLPVASFVAGVFLFGAVLLYKKWEMKQKGMAM